MPDPATGGRSTTPDAGDAGAPGDAEKVAKVRPDLSRRDVVDWGAALASESERLGGPAGPQPPPDWRQVEPETYHRGPLTEDHATPSPGDQPGNSPVSPVTGSGHERYATGAQAYNANRAANCSDHVSPTGACTSAPATARWSPPPGLGASNVPQPRVAGATRTAPVE